jgi:thioesterase domain-containing protein
VARQLRAAGQEVEFLGLLDAILPEPRPMRRRMAKVRRLMSLPRRPLAQRLWRELSSRTMRAFRPVSRSVVKYQDDLKLRSLEQLREDAYQLAASGYVARVQPCLGDVTLVVAGRRVLRELGSPTCGWSAHVPSLRVHTVDCEHLALLEEPHVREAAAVFLEGLRLASARNRVVLGWRSQ